MKLKLYVKLSSTLINGNDDFDELIRITFKPKCYIHVYNIYMNSVIRPFSLSFSCMRLCMTIGTSLGLFRQVDLTEKAE